MSKSKPKFKPGDKVRILDGSKIENYAGGWSGKSNPLVRLLMSLDEGMAEKSMDAMVGKVCTVKHSMTLDDGRIMYTVEESGFRFDERGLEPAGETWFDRPTEESPTFKKFTNNRIEIYREGRDVIALDKRTGRKAIAKCSPEDEFDFEIGAKLAFERLLKPEEKNKNKFKVGDIVIGTDLANQQYGITRKGWKGIVTKVLDGYIEAFGLDETAERCTTFVALDPNAFEIYEGESKHK